MPQLLRLFCTQTPETNIPNSHPFTLTIYVSSMYMMHWLWDLWEDAPRTYKFFSLFFLLKRYLLWTCRQYVLQKQTARVGMTGPMVSISPTQDTRPSPWGSGGFPDPEPRTHLPGVSQPLLSVQSGNSCKMHLSRRAVAFPGVCGLTAQQNLRKAGTDPQVLRAAERSGAPRS